MHKSYSFWFYKLLKQDITSKSKCKEIISGGNPTDGMMYGKWCLYEGYQWYWIGPVSH